MSGAADGVALEGGFDVEDYRLGDLANGQITSQLEGHFLAFGVQSGPVLDSRSLKAGDGELPDFSQLVRMRLSRRLWWLFKVLM